MSAMQKVFSDKKSIGVAFQPKAPWKQGARKHHGFISWEANSNDETSTSKEPWHVFAVAGKSCEMYKLAAQSLRSRLVKKVYFPQFLNVDQPMVNHERYVSTFPLLPHLRSALVSRTSHTTFSQFAHE